MRGALLLLLTIAAARGQSLVPGAALLADSTGVFELLPALVQQGISEDGIERFLADVDSVCLRLRQSPVVLEGPWAARLQQLQGLPLWAGLQLQPAEFLCLAFQLSFTQMRAQQPALAAELGRQLTDLQAWLARPELPEPQRAELREARSFCQALQAALAAVPDQNAAVYAARREALDAALTRLRAALQRRP